MKPFLLAVACLIVCSCGRAVTTVDPKAAAPRSPGDASLVQHDNPSNRSSTSAGIGLQ